MRRGVYRLDCGGMVELSGIDQAGRLIMRITVDAAPLLPEHSVMVHETLNRVDPGGRTTGAGVLRVVRDDGDAVPLA